MNLFSKLLAASGILLLIFGFYLVNLRFSPKKIAFSDVKVEEKKQTNVAPARIIIPSLKIDSKIVPAIITNNKWEVTNEGVSYLSSSPIPGDQGNSILYGHNWSSILGNLTKIKPGEKLIIVMNDGDVREFVVNYTMIVSPTQTNILDQSKDNRLTIYTCAGFLDSKRFVATALLVK